VNNEVGVKYVDDYRVTAGGASTWTMTTRRDAYVVYFAITVTLDWEI
jgi:hypothetical protein